MNQLTVGSEQCKSTSLFSKPRWGRSSLLVFFSVLYAVIHFRSLLHKSVLAGRGRTTGSLRGFCDNDSSGGSTGFLSAAAYASLLPIEALGSAQLHKRRHAEYDCRVLLLLLLRSHVAISLSPALYRDVHCEPYDAISVAFPYATAQF